MYTVWMGGEFGGEWTDMCICVAESESPIQNKKFKEKKEENLTATKKSTVTTKNTDSSVLGSTKGVQSVLGA